MSIAPADSAAVHMRPDLAAVPSGGAEPGHVVLATRAGDRGRLVTAFRQAARSRLTAPPHPGSPAVDRRQAAGVGEGSRQAELAMPARRHRFGDVWDGRAGEDDRPYLP